MTPQRFQSFQRHQRFKKLKSPQNIVDVEPWRLARQRAAGPAAEQRLATILYHLAETLRLVAAHLSPFLPVTAGALAAQLGLPLNLSGAWANWGGYPAGTAVKPAGVLFPKIEESLNLGD